MRTRILAASAAALLLLTGCGQATAAEQPPSTAEPTAAEASVEATPTQPAAIALDNCGVNITVTEPPQRIVTIKSSALELVLALGAGDRVVGNAFSDGPVPDALAAQAQAIPVLAEKLPSREAVLALEPDFIFAGWESNFSVEGVGERPELQQLGVTTYVSPAACKAPEYMPKPLTFDDVFAGFTEAGELLGEPDAAAELVRAQQQQLSAITPDGRELTAVWYSSGKDQPFVGAGIGAPQMIMQAAGLQNAFATVEDSWVSTSWEAVAEADPEVLVLVDAAWNSAAAKIEYLKAHPVASTLQAVQNERFLIVDFPATEAGVRNVDAVETLVTQLGAL